MKRKRFVSVASVVGAVLAAAALTSAPAAAHGPGGYGGWGGYMTGGGPCPGYGPGMMGYGRGMMGHGPGMMGGHSFDKELTVEDVTKIVEGRLAWRGNDRLKLGKVEEKDENTIIAEIVTVDDSLVKRLEFDRRTGARRRVR